jgi:hypothetical protein
MAQEEDVAPQGPDDRELFDHPESDRGSDEYGIAGDQDADDQGQDFEAVSFAADTDSLQRPRRQKSILQGLIEIATGGLAGTLVAYYAVAWYQGPAFDLPKFGLPGIERLTAGPNKPVSPEKQERGKDEKDGEEEDEEEPRRNVPYPWPPVPGGAHQSSDKPARENADSSMDSTDEEESEPPASGSVDVSSSSVEQKAPHRKKP